MKMLSILLLIFPLFATIPSQEIAIKQYRPEVSQSTMNKYIKQLNNKSIIKKYNDAVVKRGAIKGGGPWLAYLGYGATKAFCYGTIGAGLTAATAASVAALPVVGASAAATAATSSLVGSAIGGTALGTATASVAPLAISAAIGTSATATAVATEVTMGALTTGCVVAAVESASVCVAGLLAMIPGPI